MEFAQLDLLLRKEGRWTSGVTVEGALSGWRDVALIVSHWNIGVDEYTNDLHNRSVLADAMRLASPQLKIRLNVWVENAEDVFRSNTTVDSANVLGRYFRIEDTAPWWFHRIPTAGRLRTYLDG